MPDPGTHVLFAFWMRRFVLRVNLLKMPLFLVGSIWPDLVSRSGIILLPHKYYWFFQVLHTPLSLLLQCSALTLLFDRERWRMAFVSLTGGVLVHLALDALQSHLTEGAYFWLFPFSAWTTEFSLFPVSIWPYLLVGCAALVALSYSIERMFRRRHIGKT
jgi:hypothetical protein